MQEMVLTPKYLVYFRRHAFNSFSTGSMPIYQSGRQYWFSSASYKLDAYEYVYWECSCNQLPTYIHVIYLVFINYHDPGLIFLVVY